MKHLTSNLTGIFFTPILLSDIRCRYYIFCRTRKVVNHWKMFKHLAHSSGCIIKCTKLILTHLEKQYFQKCSASSISCCETLVRFSGHCSTVGSPIFHAQLEALGEFWGFTRPLEISYFVEINSISNHIFCCSTQWKETFLLFCSNRDF